MTEDEIKKREDAILGEAARITRVRELQREIAEIRQSAFQTFISWRIYACGECISSRTPISKDIAIDAIRAAIRAEGGEA